MASSSFSQRRRRLTDEDSAHRRELNGSGLSEQVQRQIVIVANRGPNDFVYQDGSWVTRPAAGGLVSMLAPLARKPNVSWFCCVSEPPDAAESREGLFTTAADQTDSRLNVVPVPLSARLYHAYYGQISNEVLWMLQHGAMEAQIEGLLDDRRMSAWERGYLQANERLAEAISAGVSGDAAFLVQDYHLYPLPALLRKRFPSAPILHFTHIPFPGPAAWQLLPGAWSKAIMEGFLGADVIGVQTEKDVVAVMDCCEQILRVKVNSGEKTVIAADERSVRVRAFPASTDPAALGRTMRSKAVEHARERLAGYFQDQLVVVRVDRLDPSKNQLAGFEAFAQLLEDRPELRGRVRFLAFLVPSRTDLSVYREYRDRVYALIEAINQRFGRPGGDPIVIFYTNDREQALAAMELCDVLLVNSLADGMNLVVKEWAIVSRRPGALVVSETAGVAEEVGETALHISPLDIEGTAAALGQALDLPIEDRGRRLETLKGRVRRWTAADWLYAQLNELGMGA